MTNKNNYSLFARLKQFFNMTFGNMQPARKPLTYEEYKWFATNGMSNCNPLQDIPNDVDYFAEAVDQVVSASALIKKTK